MESKGFTLIELVIGILLVAILSVTAIPKFLSMQKDARIAVLYQAKGAIATANQQLYAKAIIQSQDKIDSTRLNIDLDHDGIKDVAGYFGLIKYVNPARELAGLDPRLNIRKGNINNPDAPYFWIGFTDRPSSTQHQCYVAIYYPPAAGGEVRYKMFSDDC
ncbi:hypothetical protein VST7929_02586 [Vibrio stylophorae]|uniref:V10 pilin n=2 Tax=Vibrio stylophorae TaxID=659351 RepID=A0ABN8DUC7_9VIBR|nr:hypothetical protein VST7929_02586 [Vibrio stylophorae]